MRVMPYTSLPIMRKRLGVLLATDPDTQHVAIVFQHDRMATYSMGEWCCSRLACCSQ